MRKLLSLVVSLFITGTLLAGGLVTNNNQSALFTRMQNRNATTGIDAVYFNPAGVTKLGNGFFASVNNQSITQTQTVNSDFPYLNAPKEYIGNVKAPIFPGVYIAYNTGKLSFSAGVNPVGGGGGAEYKKGLPTFEMPVSVIPASLSAPSAGIPTSQYSADIYFKGSSAYMGYQGNVAYKVNEKLSVAIGMRFVSASNKYKGHISNISINPNYPAFGTAFTGGMVPATDFFSAGAATLNFLASSAVTAASGLTSSGAPLSTPLSAMPANVVAGVTQILGAAKISTAGMNIGTAAATLNAVAPVFTAQGKAMSDNATATQNVNVDATMSGTGITPILSINYSPTEQINFSARYEFKTKIDLKTKVAPNMGGPLFVNDSIGVGDMPAALSLGVTFRPMEKLMLTASFNEYFDKNVKYDGQTNEIDKNFLEYGLGVEYALNAKLRISAGWSHTSTGVNNNYQSAMGYSTNTNSIGFGFGYRIAPKIDLNLGYQKAFYAEGSKPFNDITSYKETYNKSTWIIGAGLDFYFGKE